MQFAQARLAAQFQDVGRPRQVRQPRVLIALLAKESEAGGVVQHRAAILGNPLAIRRIEAEAGRGHVAFEADRPGQFSAQFLVPAGHQLIHSFPRGFARRRADHDGHLPTLQEKIAQHVLAEKPRRARQKKMLGHAISQTSTMRAIVGRGWFWGFVAYVP